MLEISVEIHASTADIMMAYAVMIISTLIGMEINESEKVKPLLSTG